MTQPRQPAGQLDPDNSTVTAYGQEEGMDVLDVRKNHLHDGDLTQPAEGAAANRILQAVPTLEPSALAAMGTAWFAQPRLARDEAISTAWRLSIGTDLESIWYQTSYLPLPCRWAAIGAATRHLIGTGGYTQHQYDLLTRPWRVTVGRLHPDDPDPSEDPQP